ncbi:MAG: AmmeMemoRadiSam system protein A, partial [Firmicutes bacterium]|nr:AmmeMemoRadiSam system protein A [Bacillota bacterium]
PHGPLLSDALVIQGQEQLSGSFARFDRELIGAISRGKVEDILNFDPSMVENAGECGLRSILILLGAVTEEGFKPTVYSYEGPFGVGYMVASYLRKEDNPYIDLAKKALEAKVLGTGLKMPSPLPPELTGKAGVFVSIKKRGQLRGCIGTIEPTKENLAQEIIDNAVSAGLRDPRFPAVEPHELDELTYSVDIMGKPEAVEKLEDLDAKKYGVIVQSGHKRGLLLPDLEGVDTPEQQIAIACQKAGIGSGEKYQLFRFTVTRYQQEDI